MVDKCDCSGIKSLTLDEFSFEESLTMKDESTRLLLFKLAQQFKNVENLTLSMSVMDAYICSTLEYFLVSLCQITSAKNGSIELSVIVDTHDVEKIHIERFTPTNDIKIGTLLIYFGRNEGDYTKLFKTIATEMKHLKCIVLESRCSLFEDLEEIKLNAYGDYFPSLEMIEIYSGRDNYSRPIEGVITFVQSSTILSQLGSVRNDLVTVCHLDYGMRDSIPNVYKTFDVVHSLLIKKCILISIDVRIDFFKNIDSTILAQMKDKYWSYFNKERMEREYKQPVLNQKQRKYCHSMASPIITFQSTIFYIRIRVENISFL